MKTLYRSTALSLILGLVCLTTACPDTKNLASYGRQVVGAVEDVIPILKAEGINTLEAERAITIGNALIGALERGTGNAITLTAALISAFEDIAVSIKNPIVRTRILATLAIGNVALRYIAEKLPKGSDADVARAAGATPSAVGAVRAYTKVVYQCRWAGEDPEKRKESKPGRFAKIEECRKYPNVTYVDKITK